MQTQRMDLRTQERGRGSWDEVREWHGQIYTTKCKIASGKQPHSTGDQFGALCPTRQVGQGGWEGDIREKRYGDICLYIADSLYYTAETNTLL